MEEQKSTPQDIPQPDRTQDTMPASTPVEMTTLDSKANTSDLSAERQTSTSSHPPGPQRTDTVTAFKQAAHPPSPPSDPLPETSAVSRTVSTAIGPSSDLPVLPIKDAEETGPALTVTLLLTSGARHPFRLDSNYLRKRNVEVSNNDPYELSVYKLKELILREWRDEWEQQPASPSSIRLISFGKLLEDKAILRGRILTLPCCRRA